MNTGQYNKRITFIESFIDRSNVVTDRWGTEVEVVPTTPLTLKRWAKVINKTATYKEGQNPVEKVTIEIRCEYSKKINDDMTVIVDNITYDIETVIDYTMDRREFTIIASRYIKGA